MPDDLAAAPDSPLWLKRMRAREQKAALVGMTVEEYSRFLVPATSGDPGDPDPWPDPDMGVMREGRSPPRLPLWVFGPQWSGWITNAAEAAACPPDYVAMPLLAAASALIGNARWAQATPGWSEPPHLWTVVVGKSGSGKSPGSDCLLRDVLPPIEQKMGVDHPEILARWRAAAEADLVAEERWKAEVREAQKAGRPPPPPPKPTAGREPQAPRLRQNDLTIERVATLLANAAPKGLLVVRDELAGWIDGMNAYNDAGRAFWIEAYGGRPYRVERQKYPEPIDVPRLAVSVYGGTQPDKLPALIRGADDGLLARFFWSWPEPVPFRLGRETPGADWAAAALDRLRELELRPTDPPAPAMVRLTDRARELIEIFGREMQERQETAGVLLCSSIGKARGHVLRLALVLEMLWWCGGGAAPEPSVISDAAVAAAAHLVSDYFLPMADRVFGDAAIPQQERNASTLARWILRDRPAEVHVRTLQRDVRLPGLRTAAEIRAAADALVEAGWLRPPNETVGFQQRARVAYAVNPKLWERKA